MADFHTHVTVSSVLGCGYSVASMLAGVDVSTALVAGGLCGVSGMLPDVDSDSGIPRREAMGFAAAIVPMLLVDRFKQLNLTHDQMVLAAALLYFFIRFSAAKLIGRWSVHRGMWHSIPAVLIFAGLAFLIAGPADNLTVRYFKAAAVALGAMSHLILDEVYSVDTRGIVPKFKKSFGTAVKLWGKSPSANFSTYAKLAAVVACIAAEPAVLERIEVRNPNLAGKLQGLSNRLHGDRPPASPNETAPPALPSPGPTNQSAPSPNYSAPSYQAPNYQPPAYQPPSGQPAPWPPTNPAYQPPPAANPFPSQAQQPPIPAIRRQ